MLKYTIQNYSYNLLKSDEWKDYLFNTWLCGIVTNSDDESFGIPIVVDKDSAKLPPLPYPHFMCKSTKEVFKEEGLKVCPWIIRCDINDIINLMQEKDEYVVALYHEIGHFQYSDEQDQNPNDEYRVAQLLKGKVSKEEIQADSVAAEALGNERVIEALKKTLAPVLLNVQYNQTKEGQLFIKELQLRIKALEK